MHSIHIGKIQEVWDLKYFCFGRQRHFATQSDGGGCPTNPRASGDTTRVLFMTVIICGGGIPDSPWD
jgi:hypothetical protein